MGQKGNISVDDVNLINVLCQWKSVYMTHLKKSTLLDFFFLDMVKQSYVHFRERKDFQKNLLCLKLNSLIFKF